LAQETPHRRFRCPGLPPCPRSRPKSFYTPYPKPTKFEESAGVHLVNHLQLRHHLPPRILALASPEKETRGAKREERHAPTHRRRVISNLTPPPRESRRIRPRRSLLISRPIRPRRGRPSRLPPDLLTVRQDEGTDEGHAAGGHRAAWRGAAGRGGLLLGVRAPGVDDG
jgi:hypothetical protein